MALNRPLWMQAGGGDPAFDYSAINDRLALAALARTAGVITGLSVTQRGAGANFSVDVAAGIAAITGQDVADQGRYVMQSTATENVTIPAAPGSGSRTHRIVARVKDKLHNGAWSTYEWTLECLEDTGTGTPALPNSAIDLAYVTVTSTTVSITNAEITDKRSYAQGLPGRPLQVSSDAGRPAVPYESERIWRTDKGYFEVYNGTAWKVDVIDPPFAKLKRTANQTIANNTATAVAWDAEDEDTHNGHSTSSNNTRYTCQVAGVYDLDAAIPWVADGTGIRQIDFRKNGTDTDTGIRQPAISSFTASYCASGKVRLAVGDYVEVIVTQNSGASLAVNQGHAKGPLFSVAWVRP